MSNEKVLLYHAKCPDGFGSAFSFWKKYGNTIDYIPVSYGDKVPDLEGKEVFMGDFCFKRKLTEKILDVAKSVTIIDHHITTIKLLKDLEHPKLTKVLDLNNSGAVLCWKFLFPDKEVPEILKYIEDRDIYKWEFEDSRKILAALDSIDMVFEDWNLFDKGLKNKKTKYSYLMLGKGILSFMKKNKDSIKQNAFTLSIRGLDFPTINTGLFWRGEIVTELARENNGIAAGYFFDGEKYVFSLRSVTGDNDIDVGSVAESFPGGGGHRNAAGFTVHSLNELR